MTRFAYLNAPWGWQNLLDGEGTLHVIPLLDDRSHSVSSTETCWCRPVADSTDGPMLFHNSSDGREEFETYRRNPS